MVNSLNPAVPYISVTTADPFPAPGRDLYVVSSSLALDLPQDKFHIIKTARRLLRAVFVCLAQLAGILLLLSYLELFVPIRVIYISLFNYGRKAFLWIPN